MNLNSIRLLLVLTVALTQTSLAAPIRVLVWDEQQPAQRQVYPQFLGHEIASHLRENPRLEISTANLDQPNQGITPDILDAIDVLIWWGHVRQTEVPQATAQAIVDRVQSGQLALITLHSAHWSTPFRTAMEARLIQDITQMLPESDQDKVEVRFDQDRDFKVPSREEKPDFKTRLERTENGGWRLHLERPNCVFPSCCTPMQPSTLRTLLPAHPIAQGIPATFTLPETEMYDEPFHVPAPDEVIFEEFWAGGEHFRSGMIWKLGQGKVFYFRPGHETYHVFQQPIPMKILANACLYLGGEVQAKSSPATVDFWPGTKSDFHSFTQYNFTISNLDARVVVPREVAPGRPWIWRARFFGHEPQTDIALLEKGFHVAYVEVGGLFGSPQAVAIWDSFYNYLVRTHGFDSKAVLEGMSRGGLIIYNWAKRNPDKVYCIYADAPVCDIKSWPGGLGRGKGSASDWAQCLKVYGLTEAEARPAPVNPIDNLAPLAAARVPLLHVVGDADEVVPVDENTAILEKRYRELGGPIQVIHKKGVGHHPHSLKNPTPIVEFILKSM